MVTVIDVLVIAVALAAALGALILVRPDINLADTKRIHKLRLLAEAENTRMNQLFHTIEQEAKQATQVVFDLKNQLKKVEHESDSLSTHATTATQAVLQLQQVEQHLRHDTQLLDQHINQVQNYWEQKLDGTIENVRRVQKKLETGLSQVDESILQVREQELIAQSFNQRLIEYQKEQMSTQQEHLRLAAEMSVRLEDLMNSSQQSVQGIMRQRQRSEDLFTTFCSELQAWEHQAKNQFKTTIDQLDDTLQSAESNAEDMQSRLSIWESNASQAEALTQRIQQQFDLINSLKIDRLHKTVELTDEMCMDLQSGLENAHKLLVLLEQKTQQVLQEAENNQTQATAPVSNFKADAQQPSESSKKTNLFAVRASR